MTTKTHPHDSAPGLAEEPRKQVTPPEQRAIAGLREWLAATPASSPPPDGETLFDFLDGYIGAIDGPPEALSENTGQRFTEGLVEKQQRGLSRR